MTDRNLAQGHRVTVRHGPMPASGWISDPLIEQADGEVSLHLDSVPAPAPSPSGIPVPAVKAGWKRVGFSHFDDDIPFGSWTGDRQGVFFGRASGVDTSKRGTYRLSEISQHDSLLDMRMRKLNGQPIMGCPVNKAGSPDNKGTPSLRVSIAAKAAGPVAGWKIAWMVSKYGVVRPLELDWPECQLKAGVRPSAFFHVNGRDLHGQPDSGTLYEWHQYTTEIVQDKYARAWLDDELVLEVTDPALLLTYNVHWILQNETQIGGTLPTNLGEAHMLADWAVIEIPA